MSSLDSFEPRLISSRIKIRVVLVLSDPLITDEYMTCTHFPLKLLTQYTWF